MTKIFACPVCSHRFDPADNAACETCPLHQGCAMVCCPSCGHTTINPGQSKLAQWALRLFSPKNGARPTDGPAQPRTGLTLADARPGQQVRVTGFAPGIAAKRLAHLQAYGLIPGRQVRVVQQAPVTVVQVEHTELALEGDLARGVMVGR